ncbi:MAG: TonB-dependent receptor plug domain-containing protein [Bacteroidales bacterium]|nr:TonB-dependent receptor plug domain-containing protein [Bacteroidales bacterium]
MPGAKHIILAFAAVALAAVNVFAQVVERQDTLETSYVTAVREKMRNTTQTGLMRLDGEKLRTGVSAFGTPDVIKQLQILPGVAAGNELMSGLYVHGGDGNDNLFLLDGVPLYNIAHFGGFFSSFNTDVVDNLDFYKSGFPARYGGRLSSVVDVETSEGDMQKYHGNVSIGLIDGRLQVEGPIVKGKTSFNFGLRRSWMDVVTIPAIAYANRHNDSEVTADGGYSMQDINGRITHIFSERSKLNINAFWGRDRLTASLKSDEDTAMNLGMSTVWGTLAASANWEYEFAKNLKSRLLGYYSRSGSDVGYDFEIKSKTDDGVFKMSMGDDNICSVSDVGFKYDFNWYPDSFQHVRFGAAGVWHHYDTHRDYTQGRSIPGFKPEEDKGTEGKDYHGFEPALYIEDEIAIAYNFTLNAGLRASSFTTKERTWGRLEPRAALKWLIYKDLCFKLSYTRMSQYSHLVSAMYIELPTNSWMPSTTSAGPMMSNQIAGGLYFTPGQFTINIEGWYKTMHSMLSYNGANAFYPPLVNWEKSFTSGKGESYGLEYETTWKTPKVELSAYYTLSWTWRQFNAYYPFPYPDRNDNRHKINLVGTWRPTKRFSLYFNWNYHSGNRITLPSHVVTYSPYPNPTMLYESPYNAQLPDYHRLDVGADLSFFNKKGHRWNFNLSIYNVYNHLNASFATLDTDENGDYIGMAYGLVPIIPTLSVSYRF